MKKSHKIILGVVSIGLVYRFFIYDEARGRYDETMKPAIEAKLADKRAHPVFAGEAEPDLPDPKENFKTILGIDKNNNGIRDDVDVWINRTGKNYNEIMALRQASKGDHAFLKAAVENRTQDAEKTMNMSINGERCMSVIFASDKNDTLSEQLLLSIARVEYYPRVRGKAVVEFYPNILEFGGGGFSGPFAYKNCLFEIENQNKVMEEYILKSGFGSESGGKKWKE